MSGYGETIHGRLAELVAACGRGLVVDLGCGAGPTLRAVSDVLPEAPLMGIDRSAQSLQEARSALDGHHGPVATVVADLREPLPCADESADVVLSYNTIECLPEPEHMLAEVARVLRPGGRAVIAHVDFDSLVIAGAEDGIDRRVCHSYADDVQSWMDHADGRVGRKLGLFVAESALRLLAVEPLLAWSTEYSGHAKDRVDEIRKAVLSAAKHGRCTLSPGEVEDWYSAVRECDRRGGFFFSELAVIAVAERP